MTPLEFLRRVWPAQGLYCLAFPREPLPSFDHVVCASIEEAARYVEQIKTQKNTYFATHSLKQPRIWNKQKYRDRVTKEWVAGWSVRLQKNMQVGRDFFFDIDVGKSRADYQSQAEAFIALRDFVKICNLPRPMLVSSGNGLHVHWIVDSDLSSSGEWLTQDKRLCQLAQHYKLRVDPHRTTDTSSVLRVPGTFNIAKGIKLAVELLTPGEVLTPAAWSDRLREALEAIDVDPAPEIIPNDDIGSNVTRDASRGPLIPPSADVVYEVCGQLRRMQAAPEEQRYQEWWAALGALQFAEDGRQVCHDFSRGYGGYDPAEVDQRLDQWGAGPTSCAKLSLECGIDHADICAKCQHVGEHSGPISIARRLEKAPAPSVIEEIDGATIVYDLPNPPAPYKRSKTGEIEILMEGKNGQSYTDLVHPYDIYPMDRVSNEEAETETQLWRAHLPHGRVKTFTIAASAFVDEKALRVRLANHGIYSSRFEKLKMYMSVYIQELQKRNALNVQYNNLGWTNDQTEFVLPHGRVLSDGSLVPVALGAVAEVSKEFISKKGTLEKQIELMDFFLDQRYLANQFYIASSLGSILYHYTGHYGVIIHATGESGASKSTAMFTGAAMWGRPDRYVVNGTENGATVHFRSTRMHLLSNLPFYLDEITHIAHDVAKNMAMDNTQSEVRGRLNSDGSPKKSYSSDKSSITLTSANISFHSLLAQHNQAGTASAVRVFELQFAKLGVHEPHQVHAYMRDLKQNYGHIGEAFARFVVRHREKAGRRVIETQDELERLGRMTPDERFWFAASAATLVGIEAANRVGLLRYDAGLHKDWLLEDQLPRLRGSVKDEAQATAPLTLLTDYLEIINGDIVKIGPKSDNIWHLPNNKLLGHYDVDKGELTLLKDGFRHFCATRGQYSQAILRQLLLDRVLSEFDVQRTLGAGTNLAKGQTRCFTINMMHPSIASTETKEKLLPPNIIPIRRPKR